MPKDQNAEQKADCYSGFQLLRYENNSFDETWRPVLGEESSIRNHYNELLVCLKQSKNDRFMNIRFRLFDDGLGFRYEFPDQKKLTYFVVADELTEFAMTGDHTAWWVAGDYDTQEFEYQQTKLSGIRGRMQKAIQATSSSTPAGPPPCRPRCKCAPPTACMSTSTRPPVWTIPPCTSPTTSKTTLS